MAEWLVEHGIGEDRAALVADGAIIATRLDWHEPLSPGAVVAARLAQRFPGSRRGLAECDHGTLWVDGLGPAHPEGARLLLTVTRGAIAERGRTKLPLARPAPPDATPCPAPSLATRLAAGDGTVRVVNAFDGALTAAGWDDVQAEAASGTVAFTGGSLLVCPTPAMTLIDVDGTLAPLALAQAAVAAMAPALARLDLGGSIGLDLPTLAERRERQQVDATLGEALDAVGATTGWRGERTAINGFGFVQLVARLERPSLVARHAFHPRGAAARQLLRQAEAVREPGALRLTLHPALRRAIRPEWGDELARRTGRTLQWHEDQALAPTAGFVQAISA